MTRAPTVFDCALLLLMDACPPDNRMYLCQMGCNGECDMICKTCWTHYLFWVSNGCMAELDPYRRYRGRTASPPRHEAI